jgi:hypothetical protein
VELPKYWKTKNIRSKLFHFASPNLDKRTQYC